MSVVLGEQPLLVVLLREEEEDEHGAEQSRDDPGRIGPLVPWRNAVLAPEMMASCCDAGYREAVFAALENDLVSSACVLALTSFPELEISDPAAVA